MGNKNLAWFPHYATDWLTEPRCLSLPPMFKSYYFDLLCFQWREGSIPNDSELCRRMVGADWHLWYGVTVVGPEGEINFGDAWDSISTFFCEEGDVRVNAKLRDIAVEQQQLNARYSDRAKRGGEAKARKRIENARLPASSSPEALLTATESETESKTEIDTPNSEVSIAPPSKPSIRSMSKKPKRMWWDEEHSRIWGETLARERLRNSWVSAGMSKDEFQRQMRKLNRWLRVRPKKRGPRSNFINRINNWMNNFVAEKERREDET